MGAAAPFIMAAGAIVGAAGSYVQTEQNNKALKRSYEANKASEDIAAQRRRSLIANQYQVFAGGARASAGSRGVGQGGSSEAIQTAALATATDDVRVDKMNTFTREGAMAAETSSRLQNPLFNGIEGGFDGLMAAYSLTSGFDSLTAVKPDVVKPDSYTNYKAAGFPRPH